MNKEIDRDKVLAHISGVLSELVGQQQPKVDSELTLLYAGHRIQGGPLLDLYGTLDADDSYLVTDITLHGSTVSMIEMFPDHEKNGRLITNIMIERLSNWCDQNLPSAEQMRAEAKQDAASGREERNPS